MICPCSGEDNFNPKAGTAHGRTVDDSIVLIFLVAWVSEMSVRGPPRKRLSLIFGSTSPLAGTTADGSLSAIASVADQLVGAVGSNQCGDIQWTVAPAAVITGRTTMRYSNSIGVVAFSAALLMEIASAAAHDETKYPDLRSQWTAIGGSVKYVPDKPRGARTRSAAHS